MQVIFVLTNNRTKIEKEAYLENKK